MQVVDGGRRWLWYMTIQGLPWLRNKEKSDDLYILCVLMIGRMHASIDVRFNEFTAFVFRCNELKYLFSKLF